mgnify:CR=1 FL=1
MAADLKKNFLRTDLLLAVVLVLLLSHAYGFATSYFDGLKKADEAQKQSVFQGAYIKGVEDSVKSLLQQSDQCKPVPVTFGSATKNLVDYACAEKAFENGALQAANSLVQSSRNCQATQVSLDGKQYQFIDYSCLQQAPQKK